MKKIFGVLLVCFLCFLAMTVANNKAFAADFVTGAKFYDQINYGGTEYAYEESDEVVKLDSGLNDKFKSVKIGETSKVLAWRHYSDEQPGQIYVEWSTDHPNIDQDIRGLSKFKVVPEESAAIAARLLKATPDDHVYCLYTSVFTVGQVETCTTDQDYALVGIIDPPYFGEDLVSQITVRNQDTGEYLNNGSGYFSSVDGSSVDFDPGPNFPTNMAWAKQGNNRFDFTINNLIRR
ncbi:beta/gamma crystallin domain-containing protein [Moorena sp. SIO4G3]|uniref:beta/gamma crystallin domain-containing protein n=1 Tax=Moorena sp. SIO4G3 TaxID=2607821 RepID=UPI001428FC7D|nr:beta/gamma crystallin domain-containing protein [Moorena sp. SIO4G3]NEO79402.1 hypothetical protein [Moorena sp. SIO4G3]